MFTDPVNFGENQPITDVTHTFKKFQQGCVKKVYKNGEKNLKNPKSLKMAAITDNSDRAVVDEPDFHVGAENSGRYFPAKKCIHIV